MNKTQMHRPENGNARHEATSNSLPLQMHFTPPLHLRIVTDGSCQGNPGPGGWAVVIECKPNDTPFVELSGGAHNTTNNRMELQAAIEALRWVHATGISMEHLTVTVESDSQYFVSNLNERCEGWKRKGWRTSSGEPVKNRDQWEQLDALASAFPEGRLSVKWVRGHNGHCMNERADKLAKQAAEQAASVFPDDLDKGAS